MSTGKSHTAKEKCKINASVTISPGVRGQIDSVNISIVSPTGLVVDSETMTNISNIEQGSRYQYSYTLTPPAHVGTWTVNVSARNIFGRWASNSTAFDLANTPPEVDPSIEKTFYYPGATVTVDITVKEYNGRETINPGWARLKSPQGNETYEDLSFVENVTNGQVYRVKHYLATTQGEYSLTILLKTQTVERPRRRRASPLATRTMSRSSTSLKR